MISYNAGKSYGFDSDKSFSAYDAILHYERPEEFLDSVPESEYKPIVDSNINALKEVVEANPDTTFYFYIPTYSSLWWDNAYRDGTKQMRPITRYRRRKCQGAYSLR